MIAGFQRQDVFQSTNFPQVIAPQPVPLVNSHEWLLPVYKDDRQAVEIERPSSSRSMFQDEDEEDEQQNQNQQLSFSPSFFLEVDRQDLSAPTRAGNPIAQLFSDSGQRTIEQMEDIDERHQQDFQRLRSSSCPTSRSVSSTISGAA